MAPGLSKSVKLEFISDGKLPVFINSYVKATVELPILKQVYKIDRKSVYDNNRLYLVNEQRLDRVNIQVLGKTGNDLIFSSEQPLDNRDALLTNLNDASDGLPVKLLGEQQ